MSTERKAQRDTEGQVYTLDTKLRDGEVKPTQGDIRCIAYGHLIRLAIWSLRKGWDRNRETAARISSVEQWIQEFGGWQEVINNLNGATTVNIREKHLDVREASVAYGEEYAEIPF